MSLAGDSRLPHPGGSPPRTPLSMGSPPLVFYHPAAYAGRGRICPASARGNPTPLSFASGGASGSRMDREVQERPLSPFG